MHVLLIFYMRIHTKKLMSYACIKAIMTMCSKLDVEIKSNLKHKN